MSALRLAAALALLAGPAAAGPLPPRVLAFAPGRLDVVLTAPGRVTDIALEPGEQLSGTGAVAAGDTARWILGQAESGAGPSRRVHVLVKPTAPGLATNLVVQTDRRTYHVELRATAADWAASVAWRYPEGELVAVRGTSVPAAPAAAPPQAVAPDLADLRFAWRIEGRAPFRPLRVFDDGRRTYVDFPPHVAEGEMPPLLVAGPDGRTEPARVRVRGTRMIVDGVFEAGELRLGTGRRAARVRLVRDPGR